MLRRILFLAAVGTALALLLRAYVFEGIYVATASMEPTLRVGTHFFLEKVSLRFSRPRRGDIVVFPSPVRKEHDLIKRVIALGGEAVEIRDKAVFVNGRRLVEDYVQHTRAGERLAGDNIGPFIVPQGMMFVLGDNRDESEDSRDWKDPATGEHIYCIPVARIKGKILQFY